MLPSNTCKDMWNTFWSSLAFWVIIKLNENDFKIMEKEISFWRYPNYQCDIYWRYLLCQRLPHLQNVWAPHLQEQVHGEVEPNNLADKYAVANKKWKNSCVSTIKEKWRICKNNFLSPLSRYPYQKCNITKTAKAVNLEHGDGMEVPCILHLSGQKKMVSAQKDYTDSHTCTGKNVFKKLT